MKALHKILNITVPFIFALAISLNASAAETSLAAPAPVEQTEPSVLSGGDEAKSEAKAEKKTKVKRKKLKVQRVNHGPRKPIFPQTDRKKEKLSRARYLNSHR